MPERPHHRPGPATTTSARRFAVALSVLAALTATSCADQTPTGSSDPSPSPSATPSASGATSPTADASTSTPSSSPASPTTQASTPTMQPTTPSPSMVATTTATPTRTPQGTATAGGRRALRGKLLTAREVPGFNAEFRWKDGRTRNGEGVSPIGTCQRFSMTSIGAERTVVRTYQPGPKQSHDVAGELVASFPDETTARRAFEVLKSWRARCAGQLPGQQLRRVGRLQDVPLGTGSGTGTGAWYLLTYGPVASDPEAVWFDAQGMALVGSHIALVRLAVAGQDYNYEAGQEPMVTAVKRAAAKLS
jgi:hypothetical protein